MAVTKQALDRVIANLPGLSSGTVHVRAAQGRQDADSEGNTRLRIVAVVDPPTGDEGWGVDDVLALQSRVEELIRLEDPEAPWALVELRSSEDDPAEDGEGQTDDVEGAFREALDE